MQVVILAGGTGKRVFPLAVNKPKPMFSILGKPLLQHTIENLKSAGLKDFVIVTGHNSNQIEDYFKDGKNFGVKVRYAHQKEALGMADALMSAKDMVENNFFVVNADDFFEPSLIIQMLDEFKSKGCRMVLSSKKVEETWKFGIIDVMDGNVRKFVEKPPKGTEPSTMAVIGVYLMDRKIFDYYAKIPVSDHQYEDAIQKFIDDGNPIRAVIYDGFFGAYKYPWDLFKINEYMISKTVRKQIIEEGAEVSEKADIEGNVMIKSGTKVFANASIRGPCFIDSNCVIGSNSLIRDFSSIGKRSVIGFSTEVKHSIIGENCWFHSNYVGDSIISDNCAFGAGAVTANFRFDEKNVRVNVNDESVDSSTDKLGIFMADNSKAGVNSSMMPGVKVGPHSIVGSGVCLNHDLEPNKIILCGDRSYDTKENKIEVSTEKKKELMERLMKYKKVK
jgi:UDP-N-acetylglucosamine diphosphorylase/glucosamine-1-phosphate N-acetyltransferase